MYKDYPIPFNEEAEEAVLGSCFIDFEAIMEIKNMLTPQDFYKEKHQWVFEAMLNLTKKGEPTDQIIVVWELERMDKLKEIGGAAFISHCIAVIPTSVHIVYYAKIVKECSERRKQIEKGYKLVDEAFTPSSWKKKNIYY